MGTLTINVDDSLEKEFRETVKEFYGQGKGTLGKAVQEALKEWSDERNQEKIAKEALQMMNKGFKMGKLKYKKRSELYDKRISSRR